MSVRPATRIAAVGFAACIMLCGVCAGQNTADPTAEPLSDAPKPPASPTPNLKTTSPMQLVYPKPPAVLSASGQKISTGPTFSAEGESLCDEDGNVYFHIGNGVSYMDPTILKLGSTPDEHQLFKPPADGVKDRSLRFAGFSVTPAGRLWVLVVEWVDDKPTIKALSYDSAGDLRSGTPTGFYPSQFAVFDNDVMFVAGTITVGSGDQKMKSPFAAIIGPTGALARELRLDLRSLETKKGKLPEGAVTAGRDGNLYLLLSEEVVVISQSGEVLRKIPFTKPTREAVADRIVASGGQLAIWLGTAGKRGPLGLNLLLLDAGTGDQIGMYSPAEELGNNAICYSRNQGFEFMKFVKGSSDGSLAFLTAMPR